MAAVEQAAVGIEVSNENASFGNEDSNHVLDHEDIIVDPGLRKPIEEMRPNIRDDAKREYVLLGPCQPKGHKYPKGKYMAAIGVFMIIGTKIVLGWNIVFLRMLPFASIVISLSL